MIALTKQDVIKFINEQPDERPVNMTNNIIDPSECGCLMTDIHKSYFPDNKRQIGAGVASVGLFAWFGPDKNELDIDFKTDLMHFIATGNPASSYKELKQQALTW